jgi:glycosyltransferase involved in cell wall biosynthesis
VIQDVPNSFTLKKQKKTLIITEIPFWKQFAGHSARIFSLIDYLKDRTFLTVLYGGAIDEPELNQLNIDFRKVSIINFNTPKFGPAIFTDFVKSFMSVHHFDACIIEYIELSYILGSIPSKTKKFLDTNDLKSKRENEFARIGLNHEKFTWKQEIEIFKLYDKVIMIQKPDFLKVSRILGTGKTLCIPHAVRLAKQTVKRKVEKIGFMASSYQLNLDGLIWFLTKVWGSIDTGNIYLDIYGSICCYSDYFRHIPNVSFHGQINKLNDFYSKVDIIINPIRLGSGLKIKNIEALGSGIPLITTEHGAIGLEDIADTGFLIAHDEMEFRNKLVTLITDYSLRKRLAENSYNYISNFFSPEICYGPLEKSINE